MLNNVTIPEEILEFLQGKKQINTPFDVTISGFKYSCNRVLRLLPAKRLVLEAKNAKHHVVIKLFASNQKGMRELKKETRGHQLASASGITVPELILTSDTLKSCLAIVYRYIEDTEFFNLWGNDNYSERIAKLYYFLAKMHQYGIYQDDIHLDNLLLKGNDCYLIDLGSVICEQEGTELSVTKSLSNLAKLVAQFYTLEQELMIQQIDDYFRERGWLYNAEQNVLFLELLGKAWKKRKNQYLTKCFRSCTMTTYGHSLTEEFAFRTDFYRNLSLNLNRDIEQLMAKGEVLKAGNSATVVQVKIDGINLVIKRYNIKNTVHFLSRCWRPSRAAVSWRNANLLEFIGLPTPKPLGFIEKRIGWLRYTAYFICEGIEAEGIDTVYLKRKPTSDEVMQFSNIFKLLKKNKITHGDMKASNYIFDKKGKILMIDLDSMQEHNKDKTFQLAYRKDKIRFAKNWKDQEVQEILDVNRLYSDIEN